MMTNQATHSTIKSDSYNVYCNENLYTVHGRYRFIKEQEYRSAA